ncbi:unnamed protein product [Amoebophrya sp. A120]|nr:unnamed protein product [Amoebophrya sp. A120]|eukprot:GSA120T00020680001.1
MPTSASVSPSTTTSNTKPCTPAVLAGKSSFFSPISTTGDAVRPTLSSCSSPLTGMSDLSCTGKNSFGCNMGVDHVCTSSGTTVISSLTSAAPVVVGNESQLRNRQLSIYRELKQPGYMSCQKRAELANELQYVDSMLLNLEIYRLELQQQQGSSSCCAAPASGGYYANAGCSSGAYFYPHHDNSQMLTTQPQHYHRPTSSSVVLHHHENQLPQRVHYLQEHQKSPLDAQLRARQHEQLPPWAGRRTGSFSLVQEAQDFVLTVLLNLKSLLLFTLQSLFFLVVCTAVLMVFARFDFYSAIVRYYGAVGGSMDEIAAPRAVF